MFMYLCMYMYVYMHMYTYVCMYMYTYMFMYIYVMYVYVYITYTKIYCMYMYNVYVCTRTRACMHPVRIDANGVLRGAHAPRTSAHAHTTHAQLLTLGPKWKPSHWSVGYIGPLAGQQVTPTWRRAP
jgi:hypothetical protein